MILPLTWFAFLVLLATGAGVIAAYWERREPAFDIRTWAAIFSVQLALFTVCAAGAADDERDAALRRSAMALGGTAFVCLAQAILPPHMLDDVVETCEASA